MLGEMLAAMPKAVGGDIAHRGMKKGSSNKEQALAPPPTLAELGIDRKTVVLAVPLWYRQNGRVPRQNGEAPV